MDKVDWAEVTRQANIFIKDQIKAARLAWTGVTEIELAIEEATNEDPWGPESRTMARIASECNSADVTSDRVSNVILNRLVAALESAAKESAAKNWRQAHKALVLLDYLLLHGPVHLVSVWRMRMDLIRKLAELSTPPFSDVLHQMLLSYKGERGQDMGEIVRLRASRICELLSEDSGTLEAERLRAQRLTEERLVGFGGFSDEHHGKRTQGFGSAGPATAEGRLAFKDDLSLPEPTTIEQSASDISSPDSYFVEEEDYEAADRDSQWEAGSKDSRMYVEDDAYDDITDRWGPAPGGSGSHAWEEACQQFREGIVEASHSGATTPTSGRVGVHPEMQEGTHAAAAPSPLGQLRARLDPVHSPSAASPSASVRTPRTPSGSIRTPNPDDHLAKRMEPVWLSSQRTSVGLWNFTTYTPPTPLPDPEVAGLETGVARASSSDGAGRSQGKNRVEQHETPLIDLNFDDGEKEAQTGNGTVDKASNGGLGSQTSAAGPGASFSLLDELWKPVGVGGRDGMSEKEKESVSYNSILDGLVMRENPHKQDSNESHSFQKISLGGMANLSLSPHQGESGKSPTRDVIFQDLTKDMLNNGAPSSKLCA